MQGSKVCVNSSHYAVSEVQWHNFQVTSTFLDINYLAFNKQSPYPVFKIYVWEVKANDNLIIFTKRNDFPSFLYCFAINVHLDLDSM